MSNNDNNEKSECTHDCSSCTANCSSKDKQKSGIEREPANKYSKVKKVIGVVSGKGGVGKSLVTSLLATAMKRKGYNVGILDADVTGPSIPKAFGLTGLCEGNGEGIFPKMTKTGIEVMSVNLLLEDVTSPVIWRGPVIAGTVKQFWTDVIWNEVDFMFVDMPPGTGDVPLTVFQSLPVDGIVIVTSPQELVSLVVEKAVNMANMMNIPILGFVENYSYFMCPDCGKKHEIFGRSNAGELSEKFGRPMLAQIPFNSELANECDKGNIEFYEGDFMDKAIETIEKLI